MSAPQWSGCAALWLAAWALVEWIVWRGPRRGWAGRAAAVAVPVIFGATLLFGWEAIVRGLGVPAVILPPPSAIAARIAASPGMLAADFVQTMKGARVRATSIGCGGGFLVALAHRPRRRSCSAGSCRSARLMSAMPIVGVAPIMVMWFGFDWPSKAAVVAAVMTFFPMLVNCNAASARQVGTPWSAT